MSSAKRNAKAKQLPTQITVPTRELQTTAVGGGKRADRAARKETANPERRSAVLCVRKGTHEVITYYLTTTYGPYSPSPGPKPRAIGLTNTPTNKEYHRSNPVSFCELV